jgi:RND family efflux transporter MFP subunit
VRRSPRAASTSNSPSCAHRSRAASPIAAGAGEAATLLTTINAVDPLYFSFEGSEALYLKARREGLANGAEVEIRLADEPDFRWTGTLDFTDNALDPQSGTLRARALVRNPEGFLAPGLFGNMRMASAGTTQALLVPDTAVTTDQTRKLLLVVDGEGLVAAREVELGPLIGTLRVIRTGLQAGDRVVIEGVQSAMPGSTVNAVDGEIAPPAPAATAQPARRAAAAASSATLAN